MVMKNILASFLLFLATAWPAIAELADNMATIDAVISAPASSHRQTYSLIDIAPQTGLTGDTKTWSAEIADFNNDQRPDILLVRHRPLPETLYINSGNGFIPEDFGLPTDRHHCTAADINQDKRMDSFCSVGASRGKLIRRNNLYIQNTDGSFKDEAAQYAVTDMHGRGRWSTFLNANGDSFPDLFIGNETPLPGEQPSSNQLFINSNGETFLNGQSFGISEPIGARCSVATDFNQDELDDLFICSGQGLKLYLNQNGTHFKDVSERIKIRKHWRRALLADINGDETEDLITLHGGRLSVHYRVGDSFPGINFTLKLTNGVDIAAADADGDGDKDLFVIQSGCDQVPGNKPLERLQQRNDLLLINQGNDLFTQVTAEHLRPERGCGDQVLAIDYDADGRSEFLVLNGRSRSQGPLQLLQLEEQDENMLADVTQYNE